MSPDPAALPIPSGFHPRAWYTFPTLHGTWKPSKLHLSQEPLGRTLCGLTPPRGARHARDEREFREHMEDAGGCQRCQNSAAKRAEP